MHATDSLRLANPSVETKGDDAVSIADSMVVVDEFGQDPSVKTLFRVNPTATWRDMQPGDEILQATEDEKHALIVKRQFNLDNSKVELATIVVQSPHLRKLLGKVFEGFMGISTQLRKVELSSPFHAFCYKWDEYQQAVEELQDEVAIQHAKVLHPIISTEVSGNLDRMRDLTSHGLISYDYLWSVFEPDRDVYERTDDMDRLYKIDRVEYTSDNYFDIYWKAIDTNGTSFGFVSDKFKIEKFNGVKRIADLAYVPADHLSGIEDIRSRLQQRGAKFRDLKGIHHVTYAGSYLPTETKKRQVMSHGRVMVDCEACIASGTGASKPGLKNLQDSITDEQLIYCTTFVRGFCLTTREYAFFDIDRISPIEWADDAFQRLIISPDWKEILLSFVTSQMSHAATSDSFDDIIKGKGKGMIMLLAGTPGIGKTLTAESIAEQMHLPLYCISMGQLGVGRTSAGAAAAVEKGLKTHTELSTKWGAVLLLDECDVFLAKRSTTEIERSKLVSVFLRTLEYFQGTMFLTTNRVDALDPAFESRIHLTFNYPPLDLDARLRIWKNFVGGSSVETVPGGEPATPPFQSSLSNADLNMLAELQVNGRVIKNIVKTASLLAARKERPLAMEDVETVLRVKGLTVGRKSNKHSTLPIREE